MPDDFLRLDLPQQQQQQQTIHIPAQSEQPAAPGHVHFEQPVVHGTTVRQGKLSVTLAQVCRTNSGAYSGLVILLITRRDHQKCDNTQCMCLRPSWKKIMAMLEWIHMPGI